MQPRALSFLFVGWLWFAMLVGGMAQPLKTSDGYSLPQAGHRFQFPRDHASHPDFKIEWWYITGHLFAEDGHRFGFQATFFRRSGPLTNATTDANDAFASSQIYLAHMALLDTRTGQFMHQERLNREGWDAAAHTNVLKVHNGNWSLEMTDPQTEKMLLMGGVRSEASFKLELLPAKPLVIFGQSSLSRKAEDPTAASYYLTFSRLKVSGELQVADKKVQVTGQAWMDHEISSSQLGQDQAGWDWASLQLNDGREIMAYRMRKKDGSTDPYSTLAWVDAQGKARHYPPSEFRWEPLETWKSPKTGATYPIKVRLVTKDPATGQETFFIIEPLAQAQELDGAVGGIAYWEGACRVRDAQGREVGSAFLELTGYAQDLAGRF